MFSQYSKSARELAINSTSYGESNGNPLQYSCLDNLMDGGAWWAVVYGVAQSQTRLSELAAAAAAHHRT